jgi:hypothetical protein
MPTTINPSDQTITQYNIQTGGASNLLNNVAPSSTSGIPVISQGTSSQPIFGTAVVAGGGTGAVTLTGVLIGNGTSAITGNAVTQYDVLVGGSSNAISSVGPGSAGQVLQSGGNAGNPAYSTPTYPSASGAAGKILRADGTNNVYSTATYPDTAGTSGNVLTSDGTNWNSSPASAGNLLVADVLLTNSQIKALNSTPITIVAAAGSGKVIQVVNWYAKMVYGGTNAFTGGAGGLVLLVGGANANIPGISATSWFTGTVSAYGLPTAATGSSGTITIGSFENAALTVSTQGGAFTGNAANDNTMKIVVAYYVTTV